MQAVLDKIIKKSLFTALFILFLAAFTYAQTGDAPKADGEQKGSLPQEKVTKKLKIKSKPFPTSRGCTEDSGDVKVRVTFDKSAKVTDVILLKSSGCNIFDDNSVRAARSIKFEPEMKEGEAMTVTKQVEYNFYRY